MQVGMMRQPALVEPSIKRFHSAAACRHRNRRCDRIAGDRRTARGRSAPLLLRRQVTLKDMASLIDGA
jgi:hypothetical protein